MSEISNMLNNLHETAREWWFLKRHINGEPPQIMIGGELDGLEYYSVDLSDNTEYLLTEVGLFSPFQDRHPETDTSY